MKVLDDGHGGRRWQPSAREVETVARAIALVDALDGLGYDGASPVARWMARLQDAITPAMPQP